MSFICLASATLVLPAQAQDDTEYCTGHQNILQQGNISTDLVIRDGITCTVDGSAPDGTYLYRNVNIYGGGTLVFSDAKIDFHAHSILVENNGALYAGLNGGPIVGPLTIWLYGAPNDGVPAITCKHLMCGVPEKVWTSNENVPNKTKPDKPCKKANTEDPDSPMGDECFYQYEVFDPGTYFGQKVLALSYGGSIYLRGAKGTRSETTPIEANPSDSGTSWVRLTDDLKGGEGKFHVDRPVPTWGDGDHIVLTTTDYLPGHSEELVIDKVTNEADGALIELKAPMKVKYMHSGTAYDFSSLDGKGPQDDLNGPKTQPPHHLETRAAVALLTRSIMIASEGREPVLKGRVDKEGNEADHFPTASGYYGGHTLVRAGFRNYQVQGVEFYHLGQGGVIGRYPVHFHMDRKVPQPSTTPRYDGTYFVDNSIHDSMTRFITVHASQGLFIARNVGLRSIATASILKMRPRSTTSSTQTSALNPALPWMTL